jgi:hypothetical protein
MKGWECPMRRLISWTIFCCSPSLQAQAPGVAPGKAPDPPQQQQTIDRLKQFVADFANIACVKVTPGISAQALPAVNVEIESLLQAVFATSSETLFTWERWANLSGKRIAVYRYATQVNGSLREGWVMAEDETAAPSRIILQPKDVASRFSCAAKR